MKRGFTLVELLVVIGIIAVLIGILIPTVAAVRRAAYRADTQNLITQIGSAITRYYQDFNAYPGPFSNDQIAAGGSPQANSVALSGASDITQSENLALGLLGGLRYDGGSFTFNAADMRQAMGPVSMNPAAPKRYSAYMPASEDMLSGGQFGTGDSVVPEFVDTWPADEQLPIIYVRARVGASGIISDATTASAVYQYDRRFVAPYLRPESGAFPGDGLTALGDFSDASRVDDTPKGNALRYFAHPSMGGNNNASGTPVEKDRFILFAAGPDRIYGTADDIRSFAD